MRTIGNMELPPGPRAPAVWQTIAWMMRPAAFLQRVHARFGDPVTIRTYWTEEPMVLFSHPDAVREIFRLDPVDRARRSELGVPAPVRRCSTRSCCSTATSTCASGGCCRGRSTASGCARSRR